MKCLQARRIGKGRSFCRYRSERCQCGRRYRQSRAGV